MALGKLPNVGPAELTWNSVILGETFGGVNFRHTQETVEVFYDKYGRTVVDAITVGSVVTIEAKLTDTTVAQLNAVLYGSSVEVTPDHLLVSNSVGESLFDDAQELIIKPMDGIIPTTDTTKHIHVFKCTPVANLDVVFDNENQKIYLVEFKVFPDDTTGNVGALWSLGATS